MAEVRCPNCGRSNPDVLDVCQFCQAPLKPDSVLRIGDTPIKKNTGELESVLPEWLKDVRQQARDSAQEEAAQAAAQPKPRKDEPLDFLAGLASQSGSADEDEVPDWLARINPAKPKPEAPSAPASAPKSDLFSQFKQSEPTPPSMGPEPVQEDVPSWGDNTAAQSPALEDKDELSEWFSQAAEKPDEFIEFEPQAGQNMGWGSNFDSPLPTSKEQAPKEEEDLSWLRDLEEAAKQTGDLKAPKQGKDWAASFETPSSPSQPSRSQEDLSWLDSLGGIEEPAQQMEKPSSAPQDDLSWLNDFGAAPESAQPFDAAPDKPLPSEPFASEEDLGWLNNLGGASQPSQPFESTIPESSEKPFSQDDLSWLNSLSATSSEPSQPLDSSLSAPSTPQEEPSWLKDLGGAPEPLSTPPFAEPQSFKEETRRQTAPLGQQQDAKESEPDWLKQATEAPSMPPPGDLSMDWFNQKDRPVEEKPAPAAPEPDLFATPVEPSPLSNQEVDSLFSMEMPDWLSRSEPAAEETASPQLATPASESEDSLAPVDLPSWVQAMRPVEAVISETTPGVEAQPEEMEGPLAGLRGVIPVAPIGSAKKPKAVSLKLQATDEQQASAALLEQILGSETSPRALITPSLVASQQVLRWVLAGLFLLVLGGVIGLRSQRMSISPSLSVGASSASNIVTSLPAGSKVLVIVDYEPALAGEMEATGAPLLDQMVSRSQPNLSFISTSPNGSALVERLLRDTKINQPAPDGFGYQSGAQYLNLGYLPGGAAGVLGFIEGPTTILPAASVASFSEYAALVVMTDHAESGRVWVEQLQNRKQLDPALANQPLLVIASAQAGPLLQPYVSSRQVTGMISGLSEAARYEVSNNGRPGIARAYWDAFGIGLTLAIALIIIGSLWSVFAGMRTRRAEAQ